MIVQCGREITSDELKSICETVQTFSNLSQLELTHTICEHLSWYTASGRNKLDACQKLLQRLEGQGLLRLPEKDKARCANGCKPNHPPLMSDKTQPQEEVACNLSDILPVSLRFAHDKEDVSLVNEYLHRYHYLGYKKPFGCHLRYLIEAQGMILGTTKFSWISSPVAPW